MASNRSPQPANAAEALEHLGRLSLRQHSIKSLLQTVAELTKTVMPGDTEASITLLVKDSLTTVVSTGQLALDLDETHYERDHGPCLPARRPHHRVDRDHRHPHRQPVAGLHAPGGRARQPQLPVRPAGHRRGAGLRRAEHLRPPTGRLRPGQPHGGHRVRPYAAVAVAVDNMHAYQSAQNTANHLRIALETRGVIDRARGILMARHRLTRGPGVPGPGSDVDEVRPQAARGRR